MTFENAAAPIVPSLTFGEEIAALLIFAVVTAFFLSCLVPTEFLPSWDAANALAPPIAMNRASVATTLA